MYSARLVADKFIDLAIKEKEPITHMKLQKLIYMANGINLALNNEPLIYEHIEVWPYGPVVSSVYQTYKMFGNTEIKVNVFGYSEFMDLTLDEKAKKSLENAWLVAKGVDGIKLSNWTHNADSPWSKAKNEKLDVIPDAYIQEYFKKFLGTQN